MTRHSVIKRPRQNLRQLVPSFPFAHELALVQARHGPKYQRPGQLEWRRRSTASIRIPVGPGEGLAGLRNNDCPSSSQRKLVTALAIIACHRLYCLISVKRTSSLLLPLSAVSSQLPLRTPCMAYADTLLTLPLNPLGPSFCIFTRIS